MNARHNWNAAQRKQEQELPKARKMHGPVGERILAGETCKSCGYHKCSCKKGNYKIGSKDISFVHVGSWAWAVACMKEGHIVTRLSWATMYLRFSAGQYVSMGDTQTSNYPGRWIACELEDDIERTNDWILIAPDNPTLHKLLSSRPDLNGWTFTRSPTGSWAGLWSR